ncbi:polyprenyl synthetase family protein [Microbacterium sp.]|uniref:polyprenyl synthetase family protein n=1 Tax=Microbacterium sp. TaxID=51671 RepID=UPI003C71A4A9
MTGEIMTDSASATRQSVDAVIEDYFADRVRRASSLGTHAVQLWRRAADSARGGKGLRPRLVLLAHDELGGCDRDGATVTAAAFEILHTALLLHDDVLDGDVVRRGRPNLIGEFVRDATNRGADPRRATAWGAASGLLAGDLLLSAVHTLLARIDGPARSELHDIVDDALLLTAVGEHADIGLALGILDARVPDIRRMTELKTASYSFAAPLRAGAALAGADRATQDALSEIGIQLGFLYQLRDDMLGVFGAEDRTGKSVRGDLREGKRTLLIAFAAPEPEWQEVAHLFGRRSLSAQEAGLLRAALVACGAARAVEDVITVHLAQLERTIASARLPDGLARALREIARLCAERGA